MNREFFNHQFAALVSAYTISDKLCEQSQDVYWEMLKDIPEEKFANGVKECLAACKWFPTIAELGEASLPPIRDRRAPIPAVDRPWPMLNWREQLERQADDKLWLENKRTARPLPPPSEGGAAEKRPSIEKLFHELKDKVNARKP